VSDTPRVLIIDGDELFRQGLEFALRKLGVEPVITAESTDFLRRALNGGFALMLIDLDSNPLALEIVGQVRARLGASPRIMMVSKNGDSQNVLNALRAGANDFILKPLDRTHLAAKLSRYLRTREILENAAVTASVADSRVPGKLTCFARVTEVDERGARIESPHRIPAGTSLQLGGAVIREIAGAASVGSGASSCPVKITASWLVSESLPTEDQPASQVMYGAYAEFDRSRCDARWFRAVRRWLVDGPSKG